MSQLLYFLLIGIGIGAVYSLAALGIVTLFSGSGIVNFAQGDLMVLGALCAATVVNAGHGYVWGMLAGVVVTAVAGAALGGMFAIPLTRARYDIDVVVIGTLGVSITLTSLNALVFGDRPERIESPVAGHFVSIGQFKVPFQYPLLFAVGIAVFVAVRWLYRHTDLGIQLRAMAASTQTAKDSGVRMATMLAASWIVAGVVAAIAGVMVGSVVVISPHSSLTLGVNGFAAAIVGGLSNPLGAIIGGLTIGVAESLSSGYLNDTARQAIAPTVLLTVLMLRPQGLLGGRSSVRTV